VRHAAPAALACCWQALLRSGTSCKPAHHVSPRVPHAHTPHTLAPRPPPRPCSYAAIFKHAKDELGFCYYLIPCGKKEGQMGSCTVRRWPPLQQGPPERQQRLRHGARNGTMCACTGRPLHNRNHCLPAVPCLPTTSALSFTPTC
jgi:hypothetical protein